MRFHLMLANRDIPIASLSLVSPSPRALLRTLFLSGSLLLASATTAATAACSTKEPTPPTLSETPAPPASTPAAPSPSAPSASAPSPSATSAPAATSTAIATPDAAFLARCAAASAYSLEREGDFVLVLRDGAVLFEAGRAGETSSTPHLLASGTKSFCGIAAAIAVDDGLLTLDERVSDTIHEWKSDPEKARVSVRELLSLASGLESLSAKIDTARAANANGITDRAKASIEARFRAAPGERFIYGPSSFYVFGELMKRKLAAAKTGDKDIAAYLDRKVFQPLGIAPQFQRDAVGNPNMAGGGRIGARAWATFGEMVLDGGVVRAADGTETRIVSESTLQDVLKSHGPNPRYGLTWWLLGDGGSNPEDEVAADLAADRLEPDPNDNAVRRGIRGRLADAARRRADQAAAEARKPANADARVIGVMAAGKGKQRLYVLPEANLVVVRFGAIDGGNTYSDAEFLKLLLEEAAKPARTSAEQTSELPPK